MTFSYAVDLDLARDVVASLGAVERGVAELVVDLRWRVDHLHSTWSGTAAGPHLAAHRDWETAYAEMRDALVTMRRVVRTASENYSAAGSDNASMWESVR